MTGYLLILHLHATLLVSSAFEFQNQYKVVPESHTLEFIDRKYIDSSFGVSKINKSNAIRGTFQIKVDFPEDTRMFIRGWKWLNDNYTIPVLQFDKAVKDFIEMELFDFQSLFVHQARPPIIWPMEKNASVVYHVPGWIPDSTKYPPNLPEGKWKVELTQAFPNKIKFMIDIWFIDIKYNK